MSSNAICRRCGRELTPEDLEQGFCPVCGEPAAGEAAEDAADSGAAADTAAEDVPEPGETRALWLTDGEYVICPYCHASYYLDAAPEQCERCAEDPAFAEVRWELPETGGEVSLRLVHRQSGLSIPCADGLRLGRLHTDCLRDDMYVSRHHATILLRDGRTVVRDEGSENGTRVNGEKLQPQKARTLTPGDVLALDEQVFDVRPAAGS